MTRPATLHQHHHTISLNLCRTTSYILSFLAFWACLNAFQLSLPSLLSCASYPQLPPQPPPPPPPIISHQNGSTTNHFLKQPATASQLRPCLNFSKEYKFHSQRHNGDDRPRSRRFLLVIVSGGLNQQRNQVIDAVVIARILEAVLVIPVFQINQVWGDDSEFSDIFDEEHFKKTLREDVRVVSSLPASHLIERPVVMASMPFHAGEDWVRTHFLPKLSRGGVALLRGFDARLSKELNPDLQKLRCKVAFEAIKFRSWIEDLGEKLAEKMAEKGLYIALHLRLEKDVWVQTGCLPGLGKDADQVIAEERASHPQLLTSRSKLKPHDRYLAGLCPFNAFVISRLLKGLGVPNNTRIYWAGGEPFGGHKALAPLESEYRALYNKWNLTEQGKLNAIRNKASILAAIDYIVCLKSQVFMASHGGNMVRSLQGHRIYMGNGKHIRTLRKKRLVRLSTNQKMSESEILKRIKETHVEYSDPSLLTPNSKPSRDVVAYPIPDCMCTSERDLKPHVVMA